MLHQTSLPFGGRPYRPTSKVRLLSLRETPAYRVSNTPLACTTVELLGRRDRRPAADRDRRSPDCPFPWRPPPFAQRAGGGDRILARDRPGAGCAAQGLPGFGRAPDQTLGREVHDQLTRGRRRPAARRNGNAGGRAPVRDHPEHAQRRDGRGASLQGIREHLAGARGRGVSPGHPAQRHRHHHRALAPLRRSDPESR